jgi:hypothetical protein
MRIFDELLLDGDTSKDIILNALHSLENEEAKQDLLKLKRVSFGFPYEPVEGYKFSDDDKHRYGTLAGVEDQLLDFKGPVGLVWVITYFEKLDIIKVTAALAEARFRYLKVYQTEEMQKLLKMRGI